MRSSEVVRLNSMISMDRRADPVRGRMVNAHLPLPADGRGDRRLPAEAAHAMRTVTLLRDKAPIRGSRAEWVRVGHRRSLRRAGIESPPKGTHQFRHGSLGDARGGASWVRSVKSGPPPCADNARFTPRSISTLCEHWLAMAGEAQ